jgi:hypothetical protein
MHTGTQAEEITSLEELAAELGRHGLHATLHEPGGRLPYLHVRNPAASVLSERVYAQADAFWFSWAEKIAGCDDVTTAAVTLARVLRTVGSE